MAEILEQQCTFHLRNANISYIMRLVRGEILMHVYFGKRLSEVRGDVLHRFTAVPEEGFDRNEFRLDRLPQEYPACGYGDLRAGALTVRGEDGVDALALAYVRHTIQDGKPALNGLPATHDRTNRCKTLCVTMEDSRLGLECELYYTVFDDCDAIARHVVLHNTGRQTLTVDRVMSACVDFHSAQGQLLTLSGAWARERYMDWRPLSQGRQGVASARGASSAQSNPFMLLAERGAMEDSGEVYAFALVYSGNFTADVTVDQYGGARAMIGLNDEQFDWQLLPGDHFTTPEAVLVYAADGLGGMSREWHALCHRHVTRGPYASAQRPILLNNWEATYFNFTEEKLLALAGKAAQIGVELFVLDDGWFGHRDSDAVSLGDWVEDPRKLPDGLAGFSERIRALGLRFGLWMEPEMVSPDSDLYRAHPDWCLHAPGMPRLTGRNQLVLDMGSPQVQEYVYEAVAGALTRAKADYLKWDMNRNFSPAATAALPPARQRETAHRYMLGLYAVLERLTEAFPEVLFESCASGGGRFDLGMLYYMPQTWCSDNTDAHDRCLIQYSTSLLFPPSAMGAHVSAVPNHQTGRVTALETRSAVAMGGTYGFELDLTQIDESELERMKALLAQEKSVRDTLLYGQFIRLWNPFEGRGAAWMSLSACGRQAVVTAVRFRAAVNGGPEVLRLRGLDSGAHYAVRGTEDVYGGDELMNLGLTLQFATGDDASYTVILERVGA